VATAPTLPARLLTYAEAGEILGRHWKTVAAIVNRGELRAIRLGGRTVRIDPVDLQEYIDRHRAGEPAEAVPG
jgi:excisionase family DNA binding protein